MSFYGIEKPQPGQAIRSSWGQKVVDALDYLYNYIKSVEAKPRMVLLASDDTEVSNTGTNEATVKYFRFVKCDTVKLTSLHVHVEAKVSGGTGYIRIYIDGSLYKELTTQDIDYKLLEADIDISGLGNGIHKLEVRLANSGDYTTYQRLLEVYGII